MASSPANTIVFPVVRSDLIESALFSFWQHNDRDLHRVIVIDQTVTGLADLVDAELAHVHFRVYRNLGFAKAMNYGIRLADTPYVTCSNDDVCWFDARWWPGIMRIFDRVPNAVGVNPSCPRIPGWGFGQKEPIHVADIDSRDKCNAEGAWELLQEKTPLRGLVNGVAMWCTTFDRARLLDRIGLFDEHFFPGGGEDYDVLGRCAKAGLNVYGTHESWVWHDWGMTKDRKDHAGMARVSERPSWNRMGDLWPDGFDCWGRKGDRIEHIHIEQL